MATSAWFDYNGYMANKLAQLQKADSAAGWDMVKLVKAFADAGFVGDKGAEQHFQAHGQYEDVAPNAFFNATEYYRAKAAQFYSKDPKAVTDLDAASIQVAIKDAKMSAWSHYEQYGNTEKVNPSNSFDTEAYMNAKLTALNSVKDGKQWTLSEVNEAFKAAGLSALEHFMLYGGLGAGEVAQKYEAGKIPAEFAVPESKKVNGGGGSGSVLTLTPEIDNLLGTNGNDVLIGSEYGNANDTVNPGDQIDGGTGRDTFKFYGTAGAKFPHMSFKNVEVIESYATTVALDVSTIAGVEEVWGMGGANGTLTANLKQTIGFSGAHGAQGVAFRGTETNADATSIVLKNAGTDTAFTSLTVDNTGAAGLAKIEKLTVDASGKNQIGQFVAQSLQELIITGDGSLKMAATSDLGKANSLATVDATNNSGGVEVAIKVANLVGASSKLLGGKGNDKFILDATIGAAYTIDGGEGDDTLQIRGSNAGVTKVDAANVKNIEYLSITSQNTTPAADTSVQNISDFANIAAGLKGVNLIALEAVDEFTINNITGEALNAIKVQADADTVILTGKDFSDPTKVSDPTATVHLDNATAKSPDGIDVTTLQFDNAGKLTINSTTENAVAVDLINGTAGNANSIAALTATGTKTLFVTGNESVTITAAATAASLLDASAMSNKAGLHFELTDRNSTTSADSFAMKGSVGNDKLEITMNHAGDRFKVIDNGGTDQIKVTTATATSQLTIVNEAKDLDAASLVGGVVVGTNFGSGTLTNGFLVNVDLSSLKSALVVGGKQLGDLSSITPGGTAMTTGDVFAKGDNLNVVVASNTGWIYIDADKNGVYDTASDYTVQLIGASAAFTVAGGVLTFDA